jgi:hypothetical protein
MVLGGLGLRRVQVLEQSRGEDVATLSEQEALLVTERQDPGQLRGGITTRAPVCPGDPARRQASTADGWATRSIGREQSFER